MPHREKNTELPLNPYHLGLYMGMEGSTEVLCPFDSGEARKLWLAGWQLGYRFYHFGGLDTGSVQKH